MGLQQKKLSPGPEAVTTAGIPPGVQGEDTVPLILYYRCELREKKPNHLLGSKMGRDQEPTWQKGRAGPSEPRPAWAVGPLPPSCTLGALYRPVSAAKPCQLQAMLDDGFSPREATQVDGSGRVSHPRGLQGSKGAVSFRVSTHHLGPQEGVGKSGSSQGLGHL